MEPSGYNGEKTMRLIVTANLSSNILSRKNLLSALQKEGWTISAAGCIDGGTEELVKMGIDFVELPMENKGTGIFSDLKTFASFFTMYRKIKPDAVLHYNSKPDIYGTLAASMLGIRSISNITGLGTVYVGPDRLVRKIVNMLYRIAFLGKKSYVFFQNSEDRDLFLQLKIVPQNRCSVLPGSGVDIQSYAPVDATKGAEEPTHFLFASRLVIAKGIREFIEAAGIVKQTHENAVFDIIGEMLDYESFITREELEAAVSTGRVAYHGNAQGSRKWLETADCVVLPSYYREGVPRILLEGAAMGKPLIAADSIGTREPVSDGINGYLCEPASGKDLARCMLDFLKLTPDERRTMGTESRKVAVSRFSDEIVSKKYLEILVQGRNA